ncbi:hypothetical protein AnigIFM50267_002472 [Aspergillus niger]|nr:hypothetical protein AnigIFM50267_002472 [Aspergillus niger]
MPQFMVSSQSTIILARDRNCPIWYQGMKDLISTIEPRGRFRQPHEFHPRYYPEFPRTRTFEPILILSTTWDPVCPLVSAKKAQNSFEGARLVEQISCGIDAEYFPSARGSAVSTLSVEEEDLLSSLHALATKDVFLVRSQV